MRESRTRQISGRRFGREDLLRIAKVFVRAGGDEHANTGRRRLSFVVKANDGTVYESESPLLFADGSDALLKRPMLVEMSRTEYDSNRALHFSATHGGSHADYVRVSGEPEWVRQLFMTLTEGIEAAPTTRQWITAHPKLVRHIAALGLGSLWYILQEALVSVVVAAFGPPSPEFLSAMRSSPWLRPLGWLATHPVPYFFWTWGSRWVLGNCVWFFVGGWFFSAYPDVYLDFGPDHFKRDKLLRARFAFLGTAVALPFAIAVVYDVLRWWARAT